VTLTYWNMVDVDDCVDDKDEKTDNSCLMMLNIFSSRRHGEPDTKLPRSVRLVILVYSFS